MKKMYYERGFDYTINEIADWFHEIGYKTSIIESIREITVWDKSYPDSKITVDFWSDGLTFGYSSRRIKRKKTALKKVRETVNERISRDRGARNRESGKKRILSALSGFGIDLKSYSNTIYGEASGSGAARLRLSKVDFFKDFYDENTYSSDELNIKLYEEKGEVQLNYTLKSDKLEIFPKVSEFLQKVKENFWACGI